MQSIWLLTKKNIKLLLRAKASALIIIFAPLLIILLLGLSYNTSSKYGLNIGVYASSYTEDVNSFMELLKEQEFNIVTYNSSIEDCVQDIKSGVVHTCIAVPENLQVDGNTPKEITFYLDPSKINLVWMIQETLSSKFDFKSQQLSQELTQDLLGKLADAKSKISESKTSLSTAKDKSSSAAGITTTVFQQLSALDLTLPNTNISAEGLANVTDAIDGGLVKIGEAKTKVNDLNLTASSKSNIESSLNEAEQNLESATAYLNGPEATSVASTITAMQTELEASKIKLVAVSSAVANTGTGLESATTQIQESITSVDAVLQSLEAAQSNLDSQKVTEAGTIVQPIKTKIEKVGVESTYLNYLFPVLLIVVIMFSSLLLGTTLVMMEKNSPAFLRNFFLPIRKTTFVISTYLTNLVLILVQIIIILGISLFFLKDILSQIPALSFVLFISASVFTFLGMVIGYIFISEETAVLASISLGSIFLFVSGVIIPLEGISSTLRGIVSFNPFVLSEKLIREVFLFGNSLADVGVDLAILIGYAVVLFLVILVIESVLHQHLIERFMRHHHKKHRLADQMNKNPPEATQQ